VLALLAVAVLALAAAWVLSQRVAIERVRQAAEHRLDLYAASLDNTLAKYEPLPGIVALKEEVVSLLRAPGTPGLADSVNRYLERVNAEAKSGVLYVIDPAGDTLAASNWNDEASFVGMNLAYRPYVREALEHGSGRFYGIGTTSGVPGFYYSRPIRDGGRAIGVAVVKVSVDEIERAWAGAADIALVVDANSVVFLASQPEWKYRTYGSVRTGGLETIHATRQYPGAGLAPLDLAVEETWDGSTVLRDPSSQRRYLALARATSEPDWRLILLSDLAPVAATARYAVLFTAVLLAFLLMVTAYVQQRRREMRQRLAAKEALERAHEELERKVVERTQDLLSANERLSREIAERMRAQQATAEAQEGLVHAGKMAVLGQMAAGITHELNQPLAALRTISDNTTHFLAQNRLEDVRKNLALVSQLTDRMGRITGQLKTFARKAPLSLGPVPVRRALANALFLLERRIRDGRVEVKQDLPESEVAVRGDANRLEQVLVNLLVNALDAMQAAPLRRLEISVREEGERVLIEVGDSGTGLAREVEEKLFEPFVTTKEPGAGLGLGLTISAGIVREFGGTLGAANKPDGGARFVLDLAREKS
jgi:two-component system C4-dicarboxylate transport sensor histidine kinase DctB